MTRESAPPTPDELSGLRRLLQRERDAGFDDSAVANGLSGWVDARLETADQPAALLLRRLRRYSQLRPATRERLAAEVLDRLTPSVVARPVPPSKPGAGAQPRSAVAEGGLDALAEELWGVGPTAVKRLAALGIRTMRDMLWHPPRRYIDRSSVVSIADAAEGSEVTIIGNVTDIHVRPARTRRLRITEATIQDDSGLIAAVWFNQPYLEQSLRGRHGIAFAGRVEMGPFGRQLASPEVELDVGHMIHAGRLVPVYPLTSGITQRQLRRWIATVVDAYAPLLEDPLPSAIRERLKFPSMDVAIRDLHFPPSAEAARLAARRLSFDEFLVFQLAVLRQRRHWQEGEHGRPVRLSLTALGEFGERLPFTLTGDQRAALTDILNDLRRDRPMSRLVQGDVGSGKTVVAAGALFTVARDGWQGAMMAPTEVLAEQHAATLRELLEPLGIRLELVTGSVRAAAKRAIWQAVENQDVDVVVGTQALIQDTSRFARLNLAVVDEQQRFGVRQRGEIRAKGYHPHLLALTATPIPRTLALTLYGDLDVTTIRTLPGGRRPITTRWVPPIKRRDAYGFVRRQIAGGRQVFVICPLIMESESLQVRSAKQEHERLRTEVFPELAERIELLHGRMSGKAKAAAMERFRERQADILVSTAVVEVGIDVPNATVMMIEGAERYGLAQLHQLRGRVGRGEHRSYCLLLSDTTDPAENARLQIMQTVTDGFELAEKDLELRGPGDIFGTRQSGLLEFRFASLTDVETIMLARGEAQTIVAADPALEAPEHAGLAGAVGDALARAELS